MAASLKLAALKNVRTSLCKRIVLCSGLRKLSSVEVEHVETEEGEVKYPPIKPKFPPGSWGGMDRETAWQWYDDQTTVKEMTSINDRFNYLLSRKDILEREHKPLVLKQFTDHPDSLDFRKNATKTVCFEWDENLFQNIHIGGGDADEQLLKNLKRVISDYLLFEHDFVVRHKKETDIQSSEASTRSHKLLKKIAFSLNYVLSGRDEVFRNCQYDEDVDVRVFWERHGISREVDVKVGFDKFEKRTIHDRRVDSRCKFDVMIRSHLPLPQFVERESGMSVESQAPVSEYEHWLFGDKYFPLDELKMRSVLAGTKYGDPCEFGQVGLISTNEFTAIEEKINPKVAKDCRLAMGVTSSFSWLASQAFFQGYNYLMEAPYPLTCQTILSDGRKFQFLAYQLNTLELWKDNEASNMVNLCWHTDEIPLYHSIENGKINELNDDVLMKLIAMFKLAPAEREYDMKATLTDVDPNRHLKTDYIPDPVEVIIEEEVEEYLIE